MECIKAIKSTTELKPLFIKGNNSVFKSCFGFSFVAGFNSTARMVRYQVQIGFLDVDVLSMYSKLAGIIGSIVNLQGHSVDKKMAKPHEQLFFLKFRKMATFLRLSFLKK